MSDLPEIDGYVPTSKAVEVVCDLRAKITNLTEVVERIRMLDPKLVAAVEAGLIDILRNLEEGMSKPITKRYIHLCPHCGGDDDGVMP